MDGLDARLFIGRAAADGGRYHEGVRALSNAVPIAAAGAVCLACGGPPVENALIRPAPDAAAPSDGGDAGAPPFDAGVADAASDLGAPCTDDGQCDDAIACTHDACDPVAHRCRSTPDDGLCADGVYCNGREVCAKARGCTPGPVVTCDDHDPCTIDACGETSQTCRHDPRDADGDGDPDGHCAGGHDCDDEDPTVASTRGEICGNGKDDNCDGRIDEAPCAAPAADTCATAPTFDAPGTYPLSTRAAAKDYATSCSVASPAAARDVVARIVVPSDGPRDLDVSAIAANGEAAIALETTCGDPATERACDASGVASARVVAHALPPGTYAVLVTTALETDVALQVDMRAPTPPASNETCATAAPLAPGTARVVTITDATKDLASACDGGKGELTYAFALANPADVRLYASVLRGEGVPLVGLRNAHCTDAADELRCRSGTARPLFARDLPAGAYVVTVSATASIDVSLLLETSSPTAAPANESCATAPPLAANAITTVDLSGNDDAIRDGCYGEGAKGAYALTLAEPSDVLLVGRFPQNTTGGVSLDDATCASASRVACVTGGTPARVLTRNVPPGDYRVVLADAYGAPDTLVAYVRPAVTPTSIAGADACATAFDIPEGGGVFTGDTTQAAADFDDGCDTITAPGGAGDQVLRLALTERKHVVLTMEGSAYPTILDVRSGPTCPGTEVPGACNVGFVPARSFLDTTLDAGTYWIVVDGYGGASGPWSLDVRVLPP